MKKGRSECTDALSNLPCNIIDSILGCMSLRDAVRTSTLSKEWRNKWKSVPKLVFDVNFDDKSSIDKLEDIVDHVLLEHHGNINTFALQVPSYKTNPDIFDRWIARLPASKLQEFTLHPYPQPNFKCIKHGLPSPFFAFKNLMHLSLYRCVFQPPPQFTGFSRLITLDFQSVEVAPAVFEKFVSRCPLLETLSMVDTGLHSFEVGGPCLRRFSFHGYFKNIRLKNSPLLAQVSLAGCVLRTVSFHLLPSLEKLHLHPHVLEIFDAGGSSGCLDSFKVLDLLMYLDSVNEVACALRSASSPHLQKHHISFCATTIVEAVIEFMRGQETPDHHLNHLRKVQIADFSGTLPQIEFVRYLLTSAAGLEELVISLASSAIISDSRLMDMLKQFPHASPTVQLIVGRRGRMHITLFITSYMDFLEKVFRVDLENVS